VQSYEKRAQVPNNDVIKLSLDASNGSTGVLTDSLNFCQLLRNISSGRRKPQIHCACNELYIEIPYQNSAHGGLISVLELLTGS
jgi:hypothetical protein